MSPTSPSRPQLAIYAALAVAVLLIGARFLHSSGDDASGAPPVFATTTSVGAPDGLSAAAGADDAATAASAAGRLVVDVKGAVHRPGVYRLAAGARAYDAVRRAGGLTGRADRIGVNLAARVVDGGEVVVPERGATRASGSAPADAGSDGASDDGTSGSPLSLDLNTASEHDLEQLDGVGPAIAANIVAYREQHGGFASVDELDEVSGIGEAKLAAIRAQLGQ
ncbi:MAG TPA: helix-hairpin-helix domain-containing protein [Conexibacter sp.]|nr:helix-hairpin-helix domain-containing protein [Conexibacter sp.]